jgi:hypothetical protein
VRFVSNSHNATSHNAPHAMPNTNVIMPMLPSPDAVTVLHIALAPHPILEQSGISKSPYQ